MPIDKILEEEIGEEKEIDGEFWTNKINREGMARDVGYNQALTDLKSRIPQIKERIENKIMLKIEEDLSNGKFYSICSNETTFKNYIINTLKGGKD